MSASLRMTAAAVAVSLAAGGLTLASGETAAAEGAATATSSVAADAPTTSVVISGTKATQTSATAATVSATLTVIRLRDTVTPGAETTCADEPADPASGEAASAEPAAGDAASAEPAAGDAASDAASAEAAASAETPTADATCQNPVTTTPDPYLAPGPSTVAVATTFVPARGGASVVRTVTLQRTASTDDTDTYASAWSATSNGGGVLSARYGTVTAQESIEPQVTTISGWSTATITKTAGDPMVLKLSVTPAFGRVIKVERMGSNGLWIREATVTLPNKASADVTVALPRTWWTAGTQTKWRLTIVHGVSRGISTSPMIVQAPSRYETPGTYLKTTTKIKAVSGGYRLTPGMNGAKVFFVRKALGMGWTAYGSMTPAVRAKVAAFQKRKRLPVTGVVDKRTWVAMGLSSASWTTLDTWTTPVKANRSMTRAQRIEVMIKTALSYSGKRYVWGGASWPSVGGDCSGVVLQALYSAGLDPQPINVVKHALPAYRTSVEIYRYSKFKHVPLAQRQRGDLVFWGSNGRVSHVGIYLGGNKIYDMVPGRSGVRSYVAQYGSLRVMPQVVRPFP